MKDNKGQSRVCSKPIKFIENQRLEPRCLQQLQKQKQRQRHLPCQIRVCTLPMPLKFHSELDQPEIQQNYIRIQNELQVLARKIGELESEADEHTSVFSITHIFISLTDAACVVWSFLHQTRPWQKIPTANVFVSSAVFWQKEPSETLLQLLKLTVMEYVVPSITSLMHYLPYLRYERSLQLQQSNIRRKKKTSILLNENITFVLFNDCTVSR